MPEYRRVMIKGGTYFFTLVTYQRQKIFSSPPARVLFLKTIEYVYTYHPFTMEAYCLLPDHVHFLWQLPEEDADYSMRISSIKRHFSIKFRQQFNIPELENISRINRRESTIWQRRFWDHFIRDEDDLQRHIDYIHYNPVKHGLVNNVRDWQSSSFFDYVRLGYYDLNWGENIHFRDSLDSFGE